MAGRNACCETNGAATSRVSPGSGVAACPLCKGEGQPVKLLTVKALLDEAALRRVEHGFYRFCPHPECRTVYFDPGTGLVFTTADVRVAVWQKEPPGSRRICYCFDENEADIRAEIERHGSSRASQRVRDHIAAGRCACEVRNPHGRCCQRDLAEAVRRWTTEESLAG
jgi:hypothetical protein